MNTILFLYYPSPNCVTLSKSMMGAVIPEVLAHCNNPINNCCAYGHFVVSFSSCFCMHCYVF